MEVARGKGITLQRSADVGTLEAAGYHWNCSQRAALCWLEKHFRAQEAPQVHHQLRCDIELVGMNIKPGLSCGMTEVC